MEVLTQDDRYDIVALNIAANLEEFCVVLSMVKYGDDIYADTINNMIEVADPDALLRFVPLKEQYKWFCETFTELLHGHEKTEYNKMSLEKVSPSVSMTTKHIFRFINPSARAELRKKTRLKYLYMNALKQERAMRNEYTYQIKVLDSDPTDPAVRGLLGAADALGRTATQYKEQLDRPIKRKAALDKPEISD